MKLHTRLIGRRMFAIAVSLLTVLGLAAQTDSDTGQETVDWLQIEPFIVSSEDVIQVPVLLQNGDTEVGAFNFDFSCDELEIVGQPTKNPDRLNSGKQLAYNSSNGRVMVVSRDGRNIIGGEGPVLYLPVKFKGAVLQNKTVDLHISRISFSTADGSKAYHQEDFIVTVTEQAGSAIPYFGSEKTVVTPGKTFEVSVGVKNTVEIQGMQLTMRLPEGFTYVSSELSSRCSSYAALDYNPTTGIVVISDIFGSDAVTGFDGIVFTMTVQAPDTFGETAEIGITDLQISNAAGTSFVGEKCEPCKLINASFTLSAANAEIAKLQEELDAALATIAAECADVKDLFTGSEIQTAINTLTQSVSEAYENGTLTDNYDEVMTPAAEISTSIETLVNDARSAQAAYTAEQTAKANADAKVNELKEALTAALTTIAEECAGVKDQFTGAEIEGRIGALETLIAEAYAAGNLAATYDEVMAPAAEIATAIEALVSDAKAAQAAYAAEQTAKANADAKVAELKEALSAALATIAEECADVKDRFTGTEITEEIGALETAISEAYAAGNLAATYDDVMAPAAEIATAIEALVSDAKAAQAAYTAEQTAKANADARIAELNNMLEAALEEIAATCPDVKDQFTGAEIKSQIENIVTAVAEAYGAGTLAVNYETIVTKAAEKVESDIEALIAGAKAAQQPVTEENDAYARANEELASMRAALTSALEVIADECPDVKDDFTGEAITRMINAIETEVRKAHATKTLAVTYDIIVTEPAAEVYAAIETLVNDAKAAQILHEGEESAKKAADERIAALESELTSVLGKIAEECPDVKDQFTGSEIKSKIETLKTAVADAYAAGTLASDYNDLMTEADTIGAAIAKLYEDAKAAQEHFTTESSSKETADKAIEDLEAALSAALEEIGATCPDVKDQFTGEEISVRIEALRDVIEEAYLNGNLTDRLADVKAQAESIRAAITQLVEEAKVAQAEYEEQMRRENNENAYNEVIAQLDQLQAQLDAMIATVAEEYPEAQVTPEIVAAQTAINSERTAAQEAYASVMESGEFDYTVDTETIEQLIAAIYEKAKDSGIDTVGVDDEADARYYDLNGVEIEKPRAGMIVIKVGTTGQRSKIMVK